MVTANLYAAWIGILLGFVGGAVQGSFFHREDWLQGYASWPRRLTRLGHISFFGLAFINLAFAATVAHLQPDTPTATYAIPWCSRLFILGAITMPLVCYLSAWRKGFRHLFFIPVSSLILAAGLFLIGVLIP